MRSRYITESDGAIPKLTRAQCANLRHDYGTGRGVPAPMQAGETQRCVSCGTYRTLTEGGSLQYSDPMGRPLPNSSIRPPIPEKKRGARQ